MIAFGHMPWRPVVAMGDGTGGYDTARMTATELDACDGHRLVRSIFGDLYDHGPHGVHSVRRVAGEDEAATIERWREGVRRGWYK